MVLMQVSCLSFVASCACILQSGCQEEVKPAVVLVSPPDLLRAVYAPHDAAEMTLALGSTLWTTNKPNQNAH